MIEKKVVWSANLQTSCEATIQYSSDSEFAARRCIVEIQHCFNMENISDNLCCSNPTKSVTVENGKRLIISAIACNKCKVCISMDNINNESSDYVHMNTTKNTFNMYH